MLPPRKVCHICNLAKMYYCKNFAITCFLLSIPLFVQICAWFLSFKCNYIFASNRCLQFLWPTKLTQLFIANILLQACFLNQLLYLCNYTYESRCLFVTPTFLIMLSCFKQINNAYNSVADSFLLQGLFVDTTNANRINLT